MNTTMTARAIIATGAEHTFIGNAVARPTESGLFSRPDFRDGTAYAVPAYRFGRKESHVRKACGTALPVCSTSFRPSLALNTQGVACQSRTGATAMQSQSPDTSTTGTTALRVKAPRRTTKPAVFRITKPSGLSFHMRHLDARGNTLLDNAFDVPLEDYDHGWDTGRRAAAELLACIKARPRDGMPMFGCRLSDLLPDVEKAQAENATVDSPSRRGAALGFLSVLDAALQFAAHHADMQGFVRRELEEAENWRLNEVERKAAQRVEFVARMQAARKAKRAAKAVAA